MSRAALWRRGLCFLAMAWLPACGARNEEEKAESVGEASGGKLGQSEGLSCAAASCKASRPCCTAADTCGYDVSSLEGRFSASCLEQDQPGERTDECPAGQPLCDSLVICPWLSGCRLPDGKCGFIVETIPEPVNETDVLIHQVKLGCVDPSQIGR